MITISTTMTTNAIPMIDPTSSGFLVGSLTTDDSPIPKQPEKSLSELKPPETLILSHVLSSTVIFSS